MAEKKTIANAEKTSEVLDYYDIDDYTIVDANFSEELDGVPEQPSVSDAQNTEAADGSDMIAGTSGGTGLTEDVSSELEEIFTSGDFDKTDEVPAGTIFVDRKPGTAVSETIAIPAKDVAAETDAPEGGETAEVTRSTINTAVSDIDWTMDPDEMARTKTIKDLSQIDWSKAEEEDDGTFKGGGTHPVSYGLTDEDVYIQSEQEEAIAKEIAEFSEKIKERKKEKDERERRSKLRFRIIVVTVLVVLTSFILSLTDIFTTAYIEVRGNEHFTAEEIINIGHAIPGRNLIYHTGSKEIVQYLEQNPYIKKATVTRKLPSTLVITVEEREQACVFKYDDDYLVLDEEGMLLKKTRTKPKLTIISGMVVNRIKLGEVIGTEDNAMFSKTLKLVRTMKDSDMYFVKIEMKEDNLVKAYIYDTLIVSGDYDMLIENLKNDRLHKVVEELFSQSIRRGTITFGSEGSISFKPGI